MFMHVFDLQERGHGETTEGGKRDLCASESSETRVSEEVEGK